MRRKSKNLLLKDIDIGDKIFFKKSCRSIGDKIFKIGTIAVILDKFMFTNYSPNYSQHIIVFKYEGERALITWKKLKKNIIIK